MGGLLHLYRGAEEHRRVSSKTMRLRKCPGCEQEKSFRTDVTYCSQSCASKRSPNRYNFSTMPKDRLSRILLNAARATSLLYAGGVVTHSCGSCGVEINAASGAARHCSSCRRLVRKKVSRRYKEKSRPIEYEINKLLREVAQLHHKITASQLGANTNA